MQTALAAATADLTALRNSTPQTVIVNLAGDGRGSVTAADGEINCGLDCSEAYPAGVAVTLDALAQTGSTFAGWSGDCSGTGSCTLTLDGPKNVTAGFTLPAPPPPGPCEGGGQLVVHQTGFGQTWSNCTPLNTHNQTTAVEAALAYMAGWPGATWGLETCSFSGHAVIVYIGGIPDVAFVYDGIMAGHAQGRPLLCPDTQYPGVLWG